MKFLVMYVFFMFLKKVKKINIFAPKKTCDWCGSAPKFVFSKIYDTLKSDHFLFDLMVSYNFTLFPWSEFMRYLQLVRDISFNLPANQSLLEQLRNGTFDPTKVCDLSIEDLATDQMKKRRKVYSKVQGTEKTFVLCESTLLQNIDSVIYKDEVFVDSGGMFTCPRCRSKETVYVPKNLKSRGAKNE